MFFFLFLYVFQHNIILHLSRKRKSCFDNFLVNQNKSTLGKMAVAKFKTLKLMFLSHLFYCFIGILKQLNISAKQLLDLLLILMTYVVNLYKKHENCKKEMIFLLIFKRPDLLSD